MVQISLQEEEESFEEKLNINRLTWQEIIVVENTEQLVVVGAKL